jgi:hypothetical protein
LAEFLVERPGRYLSRLDLFSARHLGRNIRRLFFLQLAGEEDGHLVCWNQLPASTRKNLGKHEGRKGARGRSIEEESRVEVVLGKERVGWLRARRAERQRLWGMTSQSCLILHTNSPL